MNNRLMKMMPMISCKKASHLISEGMNRRLSLKESIGLKIHLLMCRACSQVLKQLKGLRRLLRAYHKYLINKSISSSGLSQLTKDKIKQVLSSQKG
jgi:hypothetical protein